jgi:Protein of unknown function (DUF3754)
MPSACLSHWRPFAQEPTFAQLLAVFRRAPRPRGLFVRLDAARKELVARFRRATSRAARAQRELPGNIESAAERFVAAAAEQLPTKVAGSGEFKPDKAPLREPPASSAAPTAPASPPSRSEDDLAHGETAESGGSESASLQEPRHREPVQLRVLQGIPMAYWQAVYPDKLLQFKPLDGLRLDLITVIGIAAVLAQVRC